MNDKGNRKMLMFKKATANLKNDFKSRGSLHIDSRDTSSRESEDSIRSRRAAKLLHDQKIKMAVQSRKLRKKHLHATGEKFTKSGDESSPNALTSSISITNL